MGSIFGSIIIGGIIGLCFFYVMRSRIQEVEKIAYEKKVVERLLVIPQLHIMYACVVYGYICFITPEFMPEDQTVRSFFQEHEIVGGIVSGLTGVDINPDMTAVYDRIEMSKTHGLIFMVIILILALVEGIGLVNRKMNRWVLEGVSMCTTIVACFYFQYAMDIQKEIMNNSTVLQLTDVITSILGVGGFSSMFTPMFKFVFWVTLFALFINHLLYHRALNKYYKSNR